MTFYFWIPIFQQDSPSGRSHWTGILTEKDLTREGTKLESRHWKEHVKNTAQSVESGNSYGAFVFGQELKSTNRFKLAVPDWQLSEVIVHVSTEYKERALVQHQDLFLGYTFFPCNTCLHKYLFLVAIWMWTSLKEDIAQGEQSMLEVWFNRSLQDLVSALLSLRQKN